MTRFVSTLILLTLTAPPVCAQDANDKDGAVTKGGVPTLKHIRIDTEAHTVEVDAVICFRQGLLELVATVIGGKEHESLLRLEARPRDLHLGLLMAGARPGSPGKWIYLEDRVVPVDPTGSPVSLEVRWDEEGQPQQRSIGQMIRDGRTGAPMGDDRFVFAGSAVIDPPEDEPDGERLYAADLGGDVISLVSFSDEVLTLPKAASNSNDQIFWEANTPQIPPLGTPVVLRITCLPSEPATPPKKDDTP